MKKLEKIDLEKQKIAYNEEKYLERQKLEQEIEKNANILIQHQKLLKITSFTGYFEFLHNNFMTPVYYEGSLYPSVTHAYHAARSTDETTRRAIINADSFHTVATIASRIQDPEDWPTRRLDIMERLVRDKFRRSKELQEKLKATEKRELIMTYEDEKKGNFYWGMVNGKGQNQLGRILMKIRDDVINNKEVFNWITTNFDLVTDVNLLPEISFTVNKNNNKIDHLVFKNKLFYKIGLLPDSDLVLAHPSISRLHAIIICDKKLGIILVDLRSKSGTKLDDVLIQDHIPYRLRDGKKINFAMSTRDYIVNIDLTKIKKVYEREKMKIEEEKDFLKKVEKCKTDEKLKEEVIKKTFGLNKGDSDIVFINRIPQEASEENLRKIFEEQFGEIKNFEWPSYRDTGLKKPFAFIQFKDKETARYAVEYGIIGYDFEENEENEFEVENENKKRYKTFMLKIKYADEDKFKPNFTKSSNQDWRKKDSSFKDTGDKKDKKEPRHNIEEKRERNKERVENKRSSNDRKRSAKDQKRKHQNDNRRRSPSSSVSNSSGSSSSSDYYSDSDSGKKKSSDSEASSSSSSSSDSSSSTEKLHHKHLDKKLNKKRNRSESS